MLRPGDTAPDFPVNDSSLYEMLELRTVALFFFPKAFTPGWTKEAREFREEYESLQKRGIAVLGVSADRQEVNDRFRADLDLPFPLVGDPDASIISAYGVKWPLVKIASRVTFIIDRERRITAAHKSARDIESHIALAREHASGN